MPISDDAVAVIRSHVGSDVGDYDSPQFARPDLEVRLGRLGTAEAVALEILRQRHADLLARPADMKFDGDMERDWSLNIKSLADKIAELERLVGRPTVTMTGMSRDDGLRLPPGYAQRPYGTRIR